MADIMTSADKAVADARAAYAAFLARPSATHVALALLVQAIIAVPLGFLTGPVPAWWIGGALAAGIWIGREFEQAAPHWRPGVRIQITWASARQAGWPATGCALAAIAAAAFYGQG